MHGFFDMRYIKISAIFFIVYILFSLIFPDLLHAQNSAFDAKYYAQKSLDLQKKGMILLGSWATLNIISGSIGYSLSENDSKYFHQMNAGWNLVNLGIASFALYHLGQSEASILSHSETILELQNLDKILLLNAGLDIGYMATGAWLWERGIRKQSHKLKGYGKSLLLQGGFLLVFDVILYLIHSPITGEAINFVDQFEISANGFRINF